MFHLTRWRTAGAFSHWFNTKMHLNLVLLTFNSIHTTILRKHSKYFSDRWLHSPNINKDVWLLISEKLKHFGIGLGCLAALFFFFTPLVLLKMAAASFEIQNRREAGSCCRDRNVNSKFIVSVGRHLWRAGVTLGRGLSAGRRCPLLNSE